MQQLYGNQTLVSSVIVTQCYMFLTLAYILFAAREGSQHSLPKPSSRSATRSSGMFQFTACSKIRKLLNFKWDSLCFKQSRRLKNSNNGSDNYALALSRLWYHKNHLGTGGRAIVWKPNFSIQCYCHPMLHVLNSSLHPICSERGK